VVAKRPAGAESVLAAAPGGGRRASCCCTSRSSGPSVRRVRDMLGDGSQEVGGGEDLEVAVDLGIEPGAVDDDVRGPFEGHLLNGERVAEDVLGQVFEVGLGLGRHLLAGVDVEAAVFPGVEDLHPFGREEFLLDQEVDDLGAEEFFQGLERGVGQGVEVES
jgi:hypothetical protein